MSKNIWIVNDYAGSPEYGMTFRHYYLAKEFVKKGYQVTIITASYSHFLKKKPKMNGRQYKKEMIDGIQYLWIKTLKYGDSFDKRRILKWLQFSYLLYGIDKKINALPDYIICSTTAPFAVKPCINLARKSKAKLLFEVRDIWPLTLVEVGGYSPKHLFIQFMGWFERLALKKSDVLVSNLQNYSTHIQNLGINRNAHWISNGIADEELDKTLEELDERVRSLIPSDKFIVGYTGKIGVSNAIDYLIETAEQMQNYKDILFVIVGEGQEKEVLQEKARELNNVQFVDAISKKQIPSMLELFDVCYIGLHREKLFTYGVSPNKLFDYMYSGKPILYAIDSGMSNIVKDANCGIVIEPENPLEIKNSVLELYDLPKETREKMGSNGKLYVKDNFTYSKLAERYLEVIKEA